MVASAPSAVRTACSMPHFTISARVCGPARSGSVASSASLVGLIASSVHGHGATIATAPIRKPECDVCTPRDEAEHATDQRDRRLHHRAAFVGRLPFDQQRAVVEQEPGGLLGHIHIDGGAGEDRSDGERENPEHHGLSPLQKIAEIAASACAAGGLYLTTAHGRDDLFSPPHHPRRSPDVRRAAGAGRAYAGRALRPRSRRAVALRHPRIHARGCGGGVVADRDGRRSPAAISPHP